MRARVAFAWAVALLGAFGAAQAAADQPRCLSARVPLAAGAVAVPEDFAPADCAIGSHVQPFHYDRASGVTRTARMIAAGEIVPRYPDFGVAMVYPGQVLKLVVTIGAVRIERDMVALQPARSGQRLFVRSANGDVLSIRYEGNAR